MWEDLKLKADELGERRIVDLFKTPMRAQHFSVTACKMRFDYSKTLLDTEVTWQLLHLADAARVSSKAKAMFAGDPINETEGRAVLHTALRNTSGVPVELNGKDIMPEITETRTRMEAFAEDVRAGEITDVINIGIGGSDLGPAMAVRALAPYHDGPRCHFVSNVDGADIADTLKLCDPQSTLVIVASKTFTTIETMTNAATAKAWMKGNGGNPGLQFAAVSSSLEKTREFGIHPSRVFSFGDYVGGRYSVWGPIGLSLMLAIGPERFRQFLAGARSMDNHFREAPLAENMPVLLALVGIWHAQILGYETRAVLPYDDRLARLPAYLQQLEMESNGKRVAMDGAVVEVPTGPIVWGEPGTNGQHAFYQLIHQGSRIVPCEFLVAARGHEEDLQHHHDLLLANCFAQSEALMVGRKFKEAKAKISDYFNGVELQRQAAHRVFPGNRPSTTLIYEQLDPETLGKIIALYEHRVFVEGVILGINSFDQWGVELGKELATALGPMVSGKASAEEKDSSTQGLIDFALRHRRADA
ncbi:MAG: glucose-6-phosphate isomerase [Marinovum sp.]|nr:glucose-6-phosphate isomerase [Marinovum sp.]